MPDNENGQNDQLTEDVTATQPGTVPEQDAGVNDEGSGGEQSEQDGDSEQAEQDGSSPQEEAEGPDSDAGLEPSQERPVVNNGEISDPGNSGSVDPSGAVSGSADKPNG